MLMRCRVQIVISRACLAIASFLSTKFLLVILRAITSNVDDGVVMPRMKILLLFDNWRGWLWCNSCLSGRRHQALAVGEHDQNWKLGRVHTSDTRRIEFEDQMSKQGSTIWLSCDLHLPQSPSVCVISISLRTLYELSTPRRHNRCHGVNHKRNRSR